MLFESFPQWLLGLRPANWASLILLASELKGAAYHPLCSPLCQAFSAVIRVVPTLPLLPCPHLIFISGSGEYVASRLAQFPNAPVMCVMEAVSKRRSTRVHRNGLTWTTIKHVKVGGVTTRQAWIGVQHLPLLKISPVVTRNLSHLLGSSCRPHPCSPNPLFCHYAATGLLRTNELHRPVVFPTSWSNTGWGARPLTDAEIFNAFDFPRWLQTYKAECSHWRSASQLVSNTIPCKLLQVVVDAWLPHAPVSPNALLPSARPCNPLDDGLHSRTWLSALQRFLPSEWVDDRLISSAAVKADNAQIATTMWDRRVSLVLPCSAHHLSLIRSLLLIRWRCNITRSFLQYLHELYGQDWCAKLIQDRRLMVAQPQAKRFKGGHCHTYVGLLPDVDAGIKILHQVMAASWWEWTHGSSLFFWRWHASQRELSRDGLTVFIQGPLPELRYRKPQRRPPPEKFDLVWSKLEQVRTRGYIAPGPVISLTDYFDVPKGESDIRMVYNGTSCGLNALLWAPNFWLPSSSAALRVLSFYSFCVDMDLGEMFLNFPLDPRIRPYAGVDLSPFKNQVHSTLPTVWERWDRLFMGLKPSPFNSVRYFYWADEFARGDRILASNPMRWDTIRLNLPGSLSYVSNLPYVMKWNGDVERIAGDVLTYVDDVRASGYSMENAWQVSRQMGSRLQFLGIQDAARKRRPPSQHPGAWAGGIFCIHPSSITKTVSSEKWYKGQNMLKQLQTQLLDGGANTMLDHKSLEQTRGFLVHLCLTFGSMVPFLKGIHLTLDSWRAKRGSEGWKMSEREWKDFVHQEFEEQSQEMDEDKFRVSKILEYPSEAPKLIKPVPRLFKDVEALSRMFQPESPPEITIRVSKVLFIYFGFGDASGVGFGSSLLSKEGLDYRVGIWSYAESEESSNCREFTNLVETMEEEAQSGNLSSSEIFFFTDNSTVESAIFHGTSSSEKLLELVIRLRVLESQIGFVLRVSHVAGTRMIAQGSDGISRGLLNEGVMSGASMMSYIPLHLSALERSPKLEPWIRSWLGSTSETLSPEGWFERGHDIDGGQCYPDGFWRPNLKPGIFIWAPPPAAADVALEELRKARIKRQKSTHLFICPRLFTPSWLRQLYKVSDIVFVVPVGYSFWPTDMYEPCLIGITFPFLRCNPWQLRGTPKMYAVGRKLQKVWEASDVDPGAFLREFCLQCWRLDHLPQHVVSRLLRFE